MLHQINLPGYATILNDFVHFQQKLLEFACTPAQSDPLTREKLKQVFPGDFGDWLWAKLWKGIPPQIGQYLQRLTNFIEDHPTKRDIILAAFAHDIDFYDHLEDPTFQFSYSNFDRDIQNVVKPLMVACYDLLSEGFPYSVQGTEQHLSRRDVATIFWKQNQDILKVCPSCDGQPPRVTSERVYSDVDHFFPKSRYPFLSIHPYNLVPICTDCNRYFKGDADPIANHQNESLLDIFHPYGRPAIKSITIQTSRGNTGGYCIQVDEPQYGTQGKASLRWKNLNNVLNLNVLWEDCYLPDVVNELVEHLRDIGNSRRDRGEQVGKDIVEDELKSIRDNYQRNVGKRLYYVLKYSYACYALSHQDELDRLAQVVTG